MERKREKRNYGELNLKKVNVEFVRMDIFHSREATSQVSSILQLSQFHLSTFPSLRVERFIFYGELEHTRDHPRSYKTCPLSEPTVLSMTVPFYLHC